MDTKELVKQARALAALHRKVAEQHDKAADTLEEGAVNGERKRRKPRKRAEAGGMPKTPEAYTRAARLPRKRGRPRKTAAADNTVAPPFATDADVVG